MADKHRQSDIAPINGVSDDFSCGEYHGGGFRTPEAEFFIPLLMLIFASMVGLGVYSILDSVFHFGL